MKRQYRLSICFALLLSPVIFADDCTVIGYHEPGTQIYDGPTICSNVHINNIDVRGPLIAANSCLLGLTKISGPLSSSNTSFETIEEKNLTAEKIQLKNASHVSGNITFSLSAGTVYLGKGSWIHGRVINGTVINN